MKKIYFTLTGTRHHFGQEFLQPDMTVKLVKEPDNETDSEAIKVTIAGLGTIGYVSNSYYTRIGESFSAGRLYDKFEENAKAEILFVTPKGVLCALLDD